MAKAADIQGILEAAILASKGLDQDAVSRSLGVSQTTVSRRLQKARDLGFLVNPPPPPPQLYRDQIPEKILEAAEDSISFTHLRGELLRRLNSFAGKEVLRTISVARTPGESIGEGDWLSRLKVVCALAATALPDLLARATRVGVAWGNTLRFLIDSLPNPLSVGGPSPVIFPIVGTFPYADNPYPIRLTSTRIANELSQALNGRIPDTQASLSAVPAFIPDGMERRPLEIFFSSLPGFREVFGGPGPRDAETYPDALLNCADMLITGLGDMPSKSGGSPTLRERLRHEKINLEGLAQISEGDIGGVLLARHGIDRAQRDRVVGINRRFIGIGLEDFQACADGCVASGGAKPGVVAIAHDESKAPAVVEAVRNRCINHLFIDSDLGESLIRMV
jgi:DNA-binding transcriptional regulator LsrR (DeoR family)